MIYPIRAAITPHLSLVALRVLEEVFNGQFSQHDVERVHFGQCLLNEVFRNPGKNHFRPDTRGPGSESRLTKLLPPPTPKSSCRT